MIQHGFDGWELQHMSWDPETGMATLQYERVVTGKLVETAEREIPQPTDPKHVGWYGLRFS